MHIRPQGLLAKLPLPATERWPEGVRFVEAFARDGLELEIYAPRGVDSQSPHSRDEIYIVIAGNAALDIDGVEHPCAAGDALFVPARVPHHFERISDDFATWVVFWGADLADAPHTLPIGHANAAQIDAAWPGDVIGFWFEELSEVDWFAKSDALDARIRERFLLLHEWIVANEGSVDLDARAMLAAVIVLDQFSRNMFRGDPRAYAADPLARRIARRCVEQGCDRAMTPNERMFLYLPFEHSEDAEDQALSLGLMAALGNPEWARYAQAHKTIVDRFGRFPHRNAVLGRASTVEEIEFLKNPANSF